MADREVRVRLAVAGTQQFQQNMNAAALSAQNLGQQTQQAAQTTQQSAQQSESAMTGFAKRAGAAIAGIGFASFVSDSISAASDLNETLNKSNVIFGANAKAIEEWANGAAENFGLSKAAALDAAAGFGDMLSQIGFTGAEAAKMSTNVVQLAADLGSFNNLETADVLDRIGASLRGEFDGLQAIIPNINAARVEQEALAESGKRAASALTEQEKATATLAIITKDGARAQGDFANTASGLANSSKIAQAQLEDTKAEIGTALLPVMQQLVTLFRDVGVPVIGALGEAFAVIGPPLAAIVSGVSDLIGFVANLPAPLTAAGTALAAIALLKFTGVFGGLRAGLGSVLSPLRSFQLQMAANRDLAAANGQRFSALGATLGAVGGSARRAGSALLGAVGGPAGLAITGAIAVITLGFSEMQKAQEAARKTTQQQESAVSALADALRESNGEIDGNVRRTIAMTAANRQVGDTGKSLQQFLLQAGISLSDYTDAVLGNGEAFNKVQQQGVKYFQSLVDNGDPDIAIAFQRELVSSLYSEAQARQLAAEQAENENRAMAQAAETRREGTRGMTEELDIRKAVGSFAKDQATLDKEAAEYKEVLAARQEAVNREYEDARAAAEAAAQVLTPFEQASKDAADAQSALADQADRVTDALDRQSGRVPSLEEANAKAAATGDALAESFKLGTKEAERLGAAVLNADGSVKTADEGGRTFRQGILDTRQAMVDQAAAAYAQAVATGNVAGASAAATRAQQGTYDQFIQTATAILGSKEAAEKAARAYGLVPSRISTTIEADNRASAKVAAARKAAEDFAQRKYLATVGIDTSAIDSQLAAAKARATSLGITMTLRSGPLQAKLRGGMIRGFAGGGRIPGTPSNPNEDDQIAYTGSGFVAVQSGEYVVNRRQTQKHLPLLRAINSGLMGFASGGQLPGGAALSGAAAYNPGEREGLLMQAFAALRGVFDDLADEALAAARKVKETRDKYRDANDDAARVAQDQAVKVRDARKKAEDDLAETRKKNAEAVAAAEKKVTEARRKSGNARGIADAEARLAIVRSKGQERLTAVTNSGNIAVARAIRAQTLANQAAHQRGVEALAEYNQAKQASASLNIRVREAQRVYRAEAELRAKQVGLAKRYDDYAKQVEATQEKLKAIRDDINQLRNDGRSTALGIRGGILGSSEFKGAITGRDVEAQLRNAVTGARLFDGTVAGAQRVGLSGDLLKTLSSDPEGRSGQVLRALASADKGTVARVNSLYATLGKTGAVTGGRIADALGLTAQERNTAAQLTAQRQVLTFTDQQMQTIGRYIGKSNAAAFKGQTLSVSLAGTTFSEVAKLEIKANNAAAAAKAAGRR